MSSNTTTHTNTQIIDSFICNESLCNINHVISDIFRVATFANVVIRNDRDDRNVPIDRNDTTTSIHHQVSFVDTRHQYPVGTFCIRVEGTYGSPNTPSLCSHYVTKTEPTLSSVDFMTYGVDSGVDIREYTFYNRVRDLLQEILITRKNKEIQIRDRLFLTIMDDALMVEMLNTISEHKRLITENATIKRELDMVQAHTDVAYTSIENELLQMKCKLNSVL